MRKEDISYQEKLTELRLDMLHYNTQNHVFIIVEGDSDIRLFRKFFDLNQCKVEAIPGGNAGVEKCVSELISITNLIIGIRDADFIHLNRGYYAKKNIFLTDYHDMEMSLILEDQVLSAVLSEHTTIALSDHSTVRDSIINIIKDISYLKWLNDIEGLSLSFEVGFQDLINTSTYRLDIDQYFSRVLGKSPQAKITDFTIIEKKINLLKTKKANLYQLTNGHDFMKTLCWLIRQSGKAKYFRTCWGIRFGLSAESVVT